MASLSSNLFSELTPKFFGVLAGPNAKLYLDVVEAIEREMPAHGDSMEREEVLLIIDQVLTLSSGLQLEEENEAGEAESIQPSSLILRRLIAAKWMEEEKGSDYRRSIYLEPAAQTLLEAFRTIVSQSVASFTGKLRLVCDRLSALTAPHSRSELIWEELKNCLVQVKTGLRELRMIRKQVERYADRQLRTATIAETLDIIYNEFSQLITQQCYRELIHARLPERLREAREGLTALEQDDFSLQKLKADFVRTETDPDRAGVEVLRTIEELAQALGDVEPTADRVDDSAADFARRSRSRLRYIQDVGSARRQQVKTIFDHVRDRLSGVRLADLEEKLQLPPFKMAEPGLLGMASLTRARKTLDPARRRPVDAPLTDADREESLRQMEKNLRNSLRLDRANKFVERLELKSGEVLSSENISAPTEDEILDVISCLVFASAGGAKYHLKTEREKDPGVPPIFDRKADFEVERFEVKQK